MSQPLPPPLDARGQAIDLAPISRLLDLIEQAWHPKAVWLFGSRARGRAHEESDWDLLVVAPDGESAIDDVRAGWFMARKAQVRSDVILCGASEFEDARETVNTLAYEATHFGVVIYSV